jgi:hypothetical protein
MSRLPNRRIEIATRKFHLTARESSAAVLLDVRFGSLADMCAAKSDVRFTPNSDRKSGLPQIVMSALPRKADMCGAT